MPATRRWSHAVILAGLTWTFGTGCAAPRDATIVRELPAVDWLAARVDELAKVDLLRGAPPLAQARLGSLDTELRVWIRTPARRALVELRNGADGVTGEMWVFWSAPSQEEDDGMFAEYRDWIDCVDRRSGHGLGMCRPKPRQPVDWTMVEAKLKPAWRLPDQAKFAPPGEIDGQLMIVERRDGSRGEVVHWDIAVPLTSEPGRKESAMAEEIWEALWDTLSLAEPPT